MKDKHIVSGLAAISTIITLLYLLFILVVAHNYYKEGFESGYKLGEKTSRDSIELDRIYKNAKRLQKEMELSH